MARSVVVQVNREVEAVLRSLGGVNSPEMIEARKTVARSWRRVLGVRGGARPVSSIKSRKVRAVGGTPSAPGQPPKRQLGRLVKSVRAGAVGDKGRVAVTWFTAPLLEQGVNTSLPTRTGRRRRGGVAKRQLVIAARPSAQRAIAQVQDQLGGIVARVAEERLFRAS